MENGGGTGAGEGTEATLIETTEAGSSFAELGRGWEDSDRNSLGSIELDGNLDGFSEWTLEEIGRSSSSVLAAVGTLLGVVVSLDTIVLALKHLKDVELTAARVPAGARSVLGGLWNVGVQSPDGWHVPIEAAGATSRHRELESENLVLSAKAMVGWDSWKMVAASTTLRAGRIAHDDELLVGSQRDSIWSNWLCGTRLQGLVGIGDGISPALVEHTGSLSTTVVHEGEPVGLSIIRPVADTSE